MCKLTYDYTVSSSKLRYTCVRVWRRVRDNGTIFTIIGALVRFLKNNQKNTHKTFLTTIKICKETISQKYSISNMVCGNFALTFYTDSLTRIVCLCFISAWKADSAVLKTGLSSIFNTMLNKNDLLSPCAVSLYNTADLVYIWKSRLKSKDHQAA